MNIKEKKVIDDTIRSCEESLLFFSNSRKSDRERWVISEFLKNLKINFTDTELKSVKSDPPDIIFRNEAFEIKEIDEKGRRRHDEYKQKLKKARSAQEYKDLPTEYEFKEITMQEAVNRINDEIKKQDYCADICRKTNILFYVNYSIIGKYHYEILEKDAWSKWRSVSLVTNNGISYVIYAAEKAPGFIKCSIAAA